MVGKCANPECGVPFLYFREGKLYRFELGEPSTLSGREPEALRRRMEYFWLCGDCVRKMTLVSEDGESVTTRLLRRPVLSAMVRAEKALAHQQGA